MTNTNIRIVSVQIQVIKLYNFITFYDKHKNEFIKTLYGDNVTLIIIITHFEMQNIIIYKHAFNILVC